MTIDFTYIIEQELSQRLTEYKRVLANTPDEALETKREELNHRYLCLQTALWMNTGANKPAIVKDPEEARTELRRWMTEIQRNSTADTMRNDGRKIAIITDFLERTKPVIPAPTQLTIQ